MSDALVDRTLVRLSAGVEGINDLISDFEQAIDKARTS
jgi:cystathionine beta-lyase/cystathionine gamma-synthase